MPAPFSDLTIGTDPELSAEDAVAYGLCRTLNAGHFRQQWINNGLLQRLWVPGKPDVPP